MREKSSGGGYVIIADGKTLNFSTLDCKTIEEAVQKKKELLASGRYSNVEIYQKVGAAEKAEVAVATNSTSNRVSRRATIIKEEVKAVAPIVEAKTESGRKYRRSQPSEGSAIAPAEPVADGRLSIARKYRNAEPAPTPPQEEPESSAVSRRKRREQQG
ncbi:MAG: hypothetical protein LBQ34_03225 [Alphaproteobacteria bacterium]|jgi:hypothetical protein|nr:hypothetical protein [Alphaproteobacteria bacterium]